LGLRKKAKFSNMTVRKWPEATDVRPQHIGFAAGELLVLLKKSSSFEAFLSNLGLCLPLQAFPKFTYNQINFR